MSESVSVGLPGDATAVENAEAVAQKVAEFVVKRSREATALRNIFSIALAGGSSPKRAYELIAELQSLDVSKWLVFFGDERACPADDPQSNYQMARSALLDKLNIDPARVHRMQGDASDLAMAADEYAQLLVRTVGDDDGIPTLDCILLGLGENGHTASLFPGDVATEETRLWCTRGRADYEPYDRLTLTFPTINAARHVAFIVTGANKNAALQDVIRGTAPAARVAPITGHLHWFLDNAADGGDA